jgi:hypothetical protein
MSKFRRVKGLYGVLNMRDGTEIDLDANDEREAETLIDKLKKLNHRDIMDFGTKDIGDEAHVFVMFSDGGELVLNKLKDVRKFVNALYIVSTLE